MRNRRWEGDERGRGIGDAREFVPGASELIDAMRTPGWVAEEPEAHLLPHLEAACARLPLELRAFQANEDGTFDVDVAWRGAADGVGVVREAIFALAGSIAESATYLRQRHDEGRLIFELVTGTIDADSPFAPHGHIVRLRVGGLR